MNLSLSSLSLLFFVQVLTANNIGTQCSYIAAAPMNLCRVGHIQQVTNRTGQDGSPVCRIENEECGRWRDRYGLSRFVVEFREAPRSRHRFICCFIIEICNCGTHDTLLHYVTFNDIAAIDVCKSHSDCCPDHWQHLT